jgi:hypothetical protein
MADHGVKIAAHQFRGRAIGEIDAGFRQPDRWPTRLPARFHEAALASTDGSLDQFAPLILEPAGHAVEGALNEPSSSLVDRHRHAPKVAGAHRSAAAISALSGARAGA